MNFVLLMVIFMSINLIVSIIILHHLGESNIEPFEYSARNLYENSNMNMFGCIICSGIIMFFYIILSHSSICLLDCVQTISYRKEKIIWQERLGLSEFGLRGEDD